MDKKVSTKNTKKPESIKQNKTNIVLLITCIFMGVALLGMGYWLLTGGIGKGEGSKIISERYVVVPYTTESVSTLSHDATNGVEPLSATNLSGSATLQSKAAENELVSEPALLDQWADGSYTYSQFYLGYIRNVPLDYRESNYYNGVNDLKFTFNRTECTQETLEESLTTCESVTKSETNSVHAGVTVSTSGKFEALVAEGEFSVSASAGWDGSWTNADTLSTSSTFLTAKSYSEANSYTVEYSINTGVAGFYRYTLFGTTDAYCISRTLDGAEYEIEYFFCARPELYFYALDYSPDEKFDYSTTDDIKLELKASDLAKIKTLPAEVAPLNESLIGSVSYDSSTVDAMKSRQRVADDGQYYGLNTLYADSDKLDMSSFEAYFNGSYIFEYNFELSMKIDNDGTQEFYLYNSATSGQETTGKKKRSEAVSAGLLAERLFNYKKNEIPVKSFTIRVPGNVVKKTMYTKFGASGDDEDKWTVAKVKCTTKVYKTKIQELYNKSNGKTIKDAGSFGLKCTSQADKINLSSFKDYLNNSNNVTIMISLLMKEQDDGSQEIYLYDNNTKSSGSSSKDVAEQNGYVANIGVANPDGKDFDYNRTDGADKTSKWVYFSIKISGEKLKQSMYLRYDANGNDGDTWIISRVNAYITVEKK